MTTRFPKESVSRFTEEKDFDVWKDRFHVVGLDLRDSFAIETFCRMINSRYKHVDILINNACQVCPIVVRARACMRRVCACVSVCVSVWLRACA